MTDQIFFLVHAFVHLWMASVYTIVLSPLATGLLIVHCCGVWLVTPNIMSTSFGLDNARLVNIDLQSCFFLDFSCV